MPGLNVSVLFMEVNANSYPGCTSASAVGALQAGTGYSTVINRIVGIAWRRSSKKGPEEGLWCNVPKKQPGVGEFHNLPEGSIAKASSDPTAFGKVLREAPSRRVWGKAARQRHTPREGCGG